MSKKILKGKVISDKSNKTIVVLVERKYQHPFLKKIVKSKKKYHAHDEKNKFKIGDTVQIEESKPYSKNKRFKILEENRWSKFKQNYL